MSFIGIYKAIYDYAPQSPDELALTQDDVLYLLEKSDTDDWWTVKKHIPASQSSPDEPEPSGLVPCTYIEPAIPIHTATALYDYERQTDEELSAPENATLQVYDVSDVDWILVGLNSQYGFMPANYLEMSTAVPAAAPAPAPATLAAPVVTHFPPPPQHPKSTPLPPLPQEAFTPQSNKYGVSEPGSEDEAPPMPQRPTEAARNTSSATVVRLSPLPPSVPEHEYSGEFFKWHIAELDGRKKKKVVLVVGNNQLFFQPESDSSSSARRHWSIADLTSVSTEKKHVFLELKNPRESIELHAGSRDVAEAIFAICGELKGANQAKALKEVALASEPSKSSFKTARVLFDFDSQGTDELSVKEDQVVYVLNDSKSQDWWMVQNVDTNRTGVVPVSYLEVIGTSALASLTNQKLTGESKKSSTSDKLKRRMSFGLSPGRSKSRGKDERDKIRERDDRERARENNRELEHRSKGSSSKGSSSMPNLHRVRTWIDNSGTFKVEAEFLGCVQGKIHLHKTNGVKIAVSAEKLSLEDLEYVEKITGTSLESYKNSLQRQRQREMERKRQNERSVTPPPKPVRPEQSTERMPERKPERVVVQNPNNHGPAPSSYDWFEFFLSCGIDVGNCQRYTLNFDKEKMDEGILEDVTPALLRTLGLREGDILRVTRFLDAKFDRKKEANSSGAAETPVSGGLFTEPTGALKVNAEPVPKVDVSGLPSPVKTAPERNLLDDDAWAVKPAISAGSTPFTGSMQDLLDIKPLVPTKSGEQPQAAPVPAPAVQPVKTGGNEVQLPPTTDRSEIAAQQTGGLVAMPTGFMPIAYQPTGFMPIQQTGLVAIRTGGLAPLQTGSFIVPLQTGAFTNVMPVTSFGVSSQMTGGIPSQTTGGLIPLQRTGGLIPLQRTGTTQLPAVMPQTSFGAMPSQITGGLIPLQRTGGTAQLPAVMPQTSFGAAPSQITGGMPSFGMPAQTTFGNAQMPGGLPQPNGFAPQTSFGTQPTGFIPQSSFGQQLAIQKTGGVAVQPNFSVNVPPLQPQQTFQTPNQFAMPQNTFGLQSPGFNNFAPPQQQMNQLNNMFQQTSISTPGLNQGQTFNQNLSQPPTSFGGSGFTGFGNESSTLQSQPTGAGFGNGPQSLLSQVTGRRANLNSATPNNPFGF
ncbi:hypothetical protein BABINDRAFT_37873 [Babjeviella inositovora NRRL Y-12698]|uniref:Actin cytoskeleton-regulatory complex protein SLA1 n=1 Tax=Babjeviella inositovora NRRL Y-12698 TaxID=984486 RepID=A0A1E3QNM9_9ASCO|nr:uncharacterized protein BABINDRAFT_37873 [Babjeviella inositovora NRRL Y-12698]ODQ79281.1 hypothetical protein BABINDRAFT_37873 [Babjeviella inositovora NRRL Y-12698]